jgi:hypothetical protein
MDSLSHLEALKEAALILNRAETDNVLCDPIWKKCYHAKQHIEAEISECLNGILGEV